MDFFCGFVAGAQALCFYCSETSCCKAASQIDVTDVLILRRTIAECGYSSGLMLVLTKIGLRYGRNDCVSLW